jgi:hypothetical protein
MNLKEIILKRSISDQELQKISTSIFAYPFLSKKIGSIAITAAEIVSRFVLSSKIDTNISGDWYNTIKLITEGIVLYGKGFAEWDGSFVYPLPPLLEEKKNYYKIGDRSIDKSKVIPVKKYSYNYQFDGLINMLKNELNVDANVYDVILQYFADYTYPTIIGTIEGASEEDLNRLKGEWADKYKNKTNSIFLLNTEIEIKQIERQLNTEAINYAYNYVLERVSAYTGIPLNLLKGLKITPEEERIFVQTVIIPLQNNIENAFFTYGIDISFKQVASGIGLLNDVSNAVKLGIITINEAREIFGLDPVDGGDQLYILNPSGVEKVGSDKK